MKYEYCRQQKNHANGFTLIELLIVIVIIGFITGVFAVTFKVLPKLKMQQSGRRFASIIKFVSSTSKTVHRPCRLILDLDSKSPSLKIQILPPGNILTNLNPIVKSKEELDEDDEYSDWPRFDPSNPIGPLGTDDTGKPMRPPLPDWQDFKVKHNDKLKLNSIRITKVAFPCINKEFYEGKIAVTFFPDGSNPGTVITVEGANQNVSNIIIEPGLSKVKIRPEDYDYDGICYDASDNEISKVGEDND